MVIETRSSKIILREKDIVSHFSHLFLLMQSALSERHSLEMFAFTAKPVLSVLGKRLLDRGRLRTTRVSGMVPAKAVSKQTSGKLQRRFAPFKMSSMKLSTEDDESTVILSRFSDEGRRSSMRRKMRLSENIFTEINGKLMADLEFQQYCIDYGST